MTLIGSELVAFEEASACVGVEIGTWIHSFIQLIGNTLNQIRIKEIKDLLNVYHSQGARKPELTGTR